VWDFIWNDLLINPMINGLIVLSRLLFDNFGLAIIAFTILVRLVTMPLTLRQLHSSRRMTAIQPKMQEIQKKYKDPKRRQEELMKLYKEEGVNPIGCLGPMLIQMPIWFALYAVLARTVGGTPERTVELSQRLYPWEFIQQAVPFNTGFLWLDLGRPDMIMVVLVGVTTWLQTKLSINQTAMASPQAAQTNQMMLWMMPVMFAWFTLTVPSGLALYWTVTNIIGIVMNYFVYGWKDRPWTDIFSPAKTQGPQRGPRPAGKAALREDRATHASSAPATGDDERQTDAQSGDKRKERRGGGGQGARTTRTRPIRGGRRSR
jgi:YidC/Oxa1 family membrane protein insertase